MPFTFSLWDLVVYLGDWIGLEKFVKGAPIVVTELGSCLAQLNNELARFGGVFWQAGCHVTI